MMEPRDPTIGERVMLMRRRRGLTQQELATMAQMSKTALNAFTRLLAHSYRDRGVLVNAVDPGWVRTDMGGSNATRSIAEGAAGIVWLAADAPQKETGKFWRDRKVIPW